MSDESSVTLDQLLTQQQQTPQNNVFVNGFIITRPYSFSPKPETLYLASPTGKTAQIFPNGVSDVFAHADSERRVEVVGTRTSSYGINLSGLHAKDDGPVTTAQDEKLLNLQRLERDAIVAAMLMANGYYKQAAMLLKISERSLKYRLDTHNISYQQESSHIGGHRFPFLLLDELKRESVLTALRDSNWVQKDAADLIGVSARMINYYLKTNYRDLWNEWKASVQARKQAVVQN